MAIKQSTQVEAGSGVSVIYFLDDIRLENNKIRRVVRMGGREGFNFRSSLPASSSGLGGNALG